MFDLSLPAPRSIVCFGAHADDIEIGCGGTLLSWVRQRPDIEITWVVWSASEARRSEAQRSAEAFLNGCNQHQIHVESFRDAFFPAEWAAIKERMAEIASTCSTADVVFTHRLEDRHQDHRVISELTWNAFRDQLVLEYEIPKFEGDLSTPNLYLPVDEAQAKRKISLLNQFFPTQTEKDWFTDSTFHALLRLRGLECRSASGLAEGFHARKIRCGIA